jgi:hypothetical protein
MGMTITGASASIRWGYQVAATLGAWTITREDGGVSLTATVVKGDTFRLSQRPLVLHATHPRGAWRFPVLALQISGVSLSAVLGPQEKTSDVIQNCSS